MKFRTLATATSTLLGAALMGYGQTQTEQRPDHSPGAPTTQQTSGAAGASATPPIQGTAHDRGPGDDARTTDQAQREATAAALEEQAGQQQQQAGQQNQQQQADQQKQQANQQQQQQGQAQQLERSEAERAKLAEERRQMNWNDAEESEIQLSELPQRARDTLQTVTAEGETPSQVARLSKDDHEVYRATFAREQENDLHIFVQHDGTVLMTKQKIEFSDAPQSVLNTFRQELELEGDAQPDRELHRIIADDDTQYALAGEGEQGEMLLVDNTGRLVEGEGRQVQDVRAGAQAGQAEDQPDADVDTDTADQPDADADENQDD